MTASPAALVDRLTASLDRLEVPWTRTTPNGLAAVLRDVVEPPAVGAPFPFEDLALPDGLVQTKPTPADLEAAATGVTAVRLGIADYGSIVLESGPDATEAASLFPGLHVGVLRAADIVGSMEVAFTRLGPALRERQSTFVLATGPSATADMGALVRGAHGPAQVHVVIVDDAPAGEEPSASTPQNEKKTPHREQGG
jgi:L-lactate dehydrogenase complex protein LldG